MRIAIDATALMKPYRTGIARYVANLVRALSSIASSDDEFVLCYRLSRFPKRKFRLPNPGPAFRSAWFGGPVRPSRMHIAHGPDHRLFSAPGAKRIVTVHDVFSLVAGDLDLAPEHFRKGMRAKLGEVARKADRILCVSFWTRDQFCEHFEVPEDRFVVIPAGVEDRFRPEAADRLPALRARIGIEGPYILVLGEISRRKNIGRLLDAFAGMPPDGPRLVFAGMPSYGHEDIAEEVGRRGLGHRVVLTGYFPDENLPPLVAGAECLVYPSLMEGFGLPVLEAQACGTPVVCSDRGALAETSGGIRVPVEPEDPDSIRDGIRKVLDDFSLRMKLRTSGLEWAARHRWDRVARRTLETYRQVLG